MAKTKKEIAVGRAKETGKCFEQLLQEESPERYNDFVSGCARQPLPASRPQSL
jgi:hypothetical protein